MATLAAFAGTALATLRGSRAPAYERAAFVVFIIGLGFLSADIWTGHADLRSIDECYLFAVLVPLGSSRRLAVLAAGARPAGRSRRRIRSSIFSAVNGAAAGTLDPCCRSSGGSD
jgi:hypothetical protein